MNRYTYEQDPGHGWIGVPVTELVQLGIAGKISDCSYYDRLSKVAWLEEDCDMSVFLTAKLALHEDGERRVKVQSFFENSVVERHVNSTRIRNMPSFGDVRERYAAQARRAEA